MNEQSQTGSQTQQDCFCGGAGPKFTHKVNEFRSKATAEHFRNSGVEFLKGIRSIVDAGIDYLSHNSQTRGTTVNVE